MSDQQDPPPPKAKPGSLRDRIAAFEKSGPAPAPAPAPALRPKPAGFSTWKPKVPSPPDSPVTSDNASSSPKPLSGGLSVTDAKDSIVKGGSLKDRMAALQGKGGFGAPPPIAPKPPVEKPKWKPPPVVSPPVDDDDDRPQAPVGTVGITSPPLSQKSDTSEYQKPTEDEDKEVVEQAGESGEVDPEEEERQRRAAITARLARLGGTRVGMAPMFGKPQPPPPSKKPSLPPQDESRRASLSKEPTSPPPRTLSEEPKAEPIAGTTTTTSPPTITSPEPESESQVKQPADSPQRRTSVSASVKSVESAESHGSRSPPSMPVPAAPRRAAPPRRKVPTKPAPEPAPQLEQPTESATVPEASVQIAEPATADASASKPEEPVSSAPSVKSLQPGESLDVDLTVVESEVEQESNIVSDEVVPVVKAVAESEAEMSSEVFLDKEDPPFPADNAKVDFKEEHQAEVSAEVSKPISSSIDEVSEQVVEEEEEEESRRKRVAERLARMGGVNPFALPSLPRRQSSTSSSPPLPKSPPPVPTTVTQTNEQSSPLLSRRQSSTSSTPALPKSPPSVPITRTTEPTTEASTIEIGAPLEQLKTVETYVEAESFEAGERKGTVPASPEVSEPAHKAAGSTEEDDSSEYEDSDSEAGGAAATKHFARERPTPERKANDDYPPSNISIPSPRASVGEPSPKPSVPITPDTKATPSAQESDDDSDYPSSEEENEDLARSQFFPPGIHPRHGEDLDTQAPLPVPHRTSTTDDGVQQPPGGFYESPPLHVPPRWNLPPPPPILDSDESGGESYTDDESALPVRPLSSGSIQLNFGSPPDARGPTGFPPSTTISRGLGSLGRPPPRALPPTPDMISGDSKAIHASSSQTSLTVPRHIEVLDDEEGDPIDPKFHSPSRRASAILPPSTSVTPPDINEQEPEIDNISVAEQELAMVEQQQAEEKPEQKPEPEGDPEVARRRTIAERMAKLGGIKFGAAPPVAGRLSRPNVPATSEEDRSQLKPQDADDAEENSKLTEEEEERARKERIASKLAGMGGMRIGMLPGALPIRKPPTAPPQEVEVPISTSPPQVRSPPARPPPPPQTRPPPAPDSESEQDRSSTASDDGVKVEAEESEIDEVGYEDVRPVVEQPPPIPTRGVRQIRRQSSDMASSPPPPLNRPPVPAGLPARRPSVQSNTGYPGARRTSADSGVGSPPQPQRMSSAAKTHSDYVMVEEPETEERPPPLPNNRPSARVASGPTRAAPTAPEAQESISSQWELPNIPTSNLDFGNEDLSLSWTEADAIVPLEESITLVPPYVAPPAVQQLRSSNDVQLSADELMSVWGRVGVQVCEAATNLFDKSKKGLVGDGTYPGFVNAVLREIPNAAQTNDWGYLVYKQTGSSVQKRASDIMPGDIVEVIDAKFKGHKGLHAYQQAIGTEEPVVGVVSEFEPKKSKLRVFQANQHVGQQTVEAVSYRLDDLKSGTVKINRVLEA
ncbi:hypothetical protein FA15DRAFT_669013 [Coprinopsis marcescibilis]|uniref:BBC1/AIM3 cysteine proteinase-fold domain-containing protein n=1 Tax=Coprinopsis marcescibilis TaxID=230819 RepID=A0A5C3KXE4_COPMA|nr:hypothetical protein FA15DRAFT_669013 [Coprinopsis marcescibilis]